MNERMVADKLARKVMAHTSTGADFPWAVVIIGKRSVRFSIARAPDVNVFTGTQPYQNTPMKAIEYVFGLIRKMKVPESNVEVITE